MLQELPHESFAFQIDSISFILKLYSVKGDNEMVMPVVDFTISQGAKNEEGTGFRISDLHFLISDKLKAIEQLYNNYSRVDNGYNKVEVIKLEVDYYLIGDYHLKFLIDEEEDRNRVVVKSKNDVLFKSTGNVHLQHFIKSIEMINEGIKDFLIKNNYFNKFFDKYTYDASDPNHQ